ncbi:F-box only protein 15 [Aplysia californica]|uniref:F-box only protein 15 n=1 Tax=Aplysia californica TaxID=6500 RepID=A0ABM0JH54_APLCA|nr:F-box only protein 15 [Aplysia californica]
MAASTNAQQQHRTKLTEYLHSQAKPVHLESSVKRDSDRRAQRQSSSSKGLRNSQRTKPSLPNNKSQNISGHLRLPSIPKLPGNGRPRKATIESLPNEILSMIFWKLKIGDLIVASQVCRRWNFVACDNLLWKQYYAKFAGPVEKEKEASMPVHQLDSGCWKYLCLKRCKVKRDQIYLKKWKKPDSYTGLKQRPELSLGKVGVRFDLSFTDAQGVEHPMNQSDIFWMSMSCTIRWYDLVFPDFKDIHGLKIHACSPLMFYGPSKPAKDGIIQRSLLLELKGSLRNKMSGLKPLTSDNHIELYQLSSGFILGKYLAGGDIAFIATTFHYQNFVSRCLCGSADRSWAPPERVAFEDDIDSQYGLHGYTCILLLRNMRQKILECKFTDLYTRRESVANGFATFVPVKKDDKLTHCACLKDINFPWKTALFKGIMQNVCILDMTLLEESGEPFWTVSSLVEIQNSSETNQFDFDPNAYQSINYEDPTGKVHFEIGQLDDGLQYLCEAKISLSVPAINKYFRTSY